MPKSGVFLTDTDGELVEVDPRDPLVMLDITWRARRMREADEMRRMADAIRGMAESMASIRARGLAVRLRLR